MEKSAVMVDCYRYLLSRVWTPLPHDYGYVNFLMLNPSTADHKEDDPTITRCINFAQNWGFDAMYITNLFAYKTPYPKFMEESAAGGIDVVGPENNHWVLACAKSAALVVLAWGANGNMFNSARKYEVLQLLYLHDIGMATIGTKMTKNNNPRHPLYLTKDSRLHYLYFTEKTGTYEDGTGRAAVQKFEEGTGTA
jgi:hypothetical protein